MTTVRERFDIPAIEAVANPHSNRYAKDGECEGCSGIVREYAEGLNASPEAVRVYLQVHHQIHYDIRTMYAALKVCQEAIAPITPSEVKSKEEVWEGKTDLSPVPTPLTPTITIQLPPPGDQTGLPELLIVPPTEGALTPTSEGPRDENLSPASEYGGRSSSDIEDYPIFFQYPKLRTAATFDEENLAHFFEIPTWRHPNREIIPGFRALEPWQDRQQDLLTRIKEWEQKAGLLDQFKLKEIEDLASLHAKREESKIPRSRSIRRRINRALGISRS